jgi:O-antigen/teichoic acid export membrane protein
MGFMGFRVMSDSADFSKEAVGRGAIWSILNNTVSQVLVLVVFLVTARFVSIDDFGIMAICFVVIEGFRQIAIEGIATAITARKNPDERDYSACFLLTLAISFVGAAAVYLAAMPLAGLFKNPEIGPALQIVAALLPAIGLSRTHEAWLAKHMKFKSLALRSLISIVIGGAVGIAMAINGFGLMSLIAQQLLTAIVGVLFLWTASGWRPSFKTDIETMMRLFHESRFIFLTNTTNFVTFQTDIFFATYYLGVAATGIYNAGKRIILALSMIISTALGRVTLPTFANVQDDLGKLGRSYLQAVSYTSTLTAPIYAGLMALSPQIIFILLGPTWADAAPVVAILAISAFIVTFGQYNSNILLVRGKSHVQSLLSLGYAITNIIVFVIFARYGLLALAWAYSLRVLVLFPISVAITLRILNLSPMAYLKTLYPAIPAAMGMAAIVYEASVLLSLHAVFEVMILVPAGAVIYGGLIFLMDRKGTMDMVKLGIAILKKSPVKK